MLIKTRLFGDVDVEQEKIISFDAGIIGFSDMKHFTLITNEEEGKTSHICWLQSVEESEFAIPVIDPHLVKEDYNPSVEDDWLVAIGQLTETELSVFITITVPAEIEKMTVNLKAPIIINSGTMKACQLILEDNEYPVRFPIYDILKNSEEAGE